MKKTAFWAKIKHPTGRVTQEVRGLRGNACADGEVCANPRRPSQPTCRVRARPRCSTPGQAISASKPHRKASRGRPCRRTEKAGWMRTKRGRRTKGGSQGANLLQAFVCFPRSYIIMNGYKSSFWLCANSPNSGSITRFPQPIPCQ